MGEDGEPVAHHDPEGSVLPVHSFAASRKARGQDVCTMLLNWFLKYVRNSSNKLGIYYLSCFCDAGKLIKHYRMLVKMHKLETYCDFPEMTLWPEESDKKPEIWFPYLGKVQIQAKLDFL